MMRNENIPVEIAKTDMAISDLTDKGYLVHEQMKKFLKVAIKNADFMPYAKVTTMKNPTQQIAKMTTMGRVMHPGLESEALAVSQRSKAGFDAVLLTSQEGKAEIHWPRSVLEDQIERAGFESSLISYMGEHVAGDLDDALISGDTTSADDWLALADGALAKATSNVYPGGSVELVKSVLKNLMLTRPEEFDGKSPDAFYTNRHARINYLDGISDRATTLGDTVIEGRFGKELGYQGIPLRKVSRFPSDLDPGATCTNVLYGNIKGLIMAFQRKVSMDREFRISPQVYVVVITLRVAVEYEHEPTLAKATQVLGS
jgi:hypothetical protein